MFFADFLPNHQKALFFKAKTSFSLTKKRQIFTDVRRYKIETDNFSAWEIIITQHDRFDRLGPQAFRRMRTVRTHLLLDSHLSLKVDRARPAEQIETNKFRKKDFTFDFYVF